MTQPVVLLDADGVLLNFIQATLDTLQDVAPHSFTHDDVHTWEVFSSLPEAMQAHMGAVYDRLKKEGGRSIKPYPGAAEAVKKLQDIAEVLIVTSPFHGSPTWAHEREHALEQHFRIHHTDVIHAKRKEFVRGDVFVDDKLDNVLKWRAANPQGKAIHWSNDTVGGSDITCTKHWHVVLEQAQSFLGRPQ